MAEKAPPCCDNSSQLDLPIDAVATCVYVGSLHLMGSGQYVPEPGKSIGTTTFDLTSTLSGCSFYGDSPITSTQGLSITGAVTQTAEVSLLTYAGTLSWEDSGKSCDVQMTIYGDNWSGFGGTICGVTVNPSTINNL